MCSKTHVSGTCDAAPARVHPGHATCGGAGDVCCDDDVANIMDKLVSLSILIQVNVSKQMDMPVCASL